MFTICRRRDPIRWCAPTSKDAAVGAQWRRAERNNRISSICPRLHALVFGHALSGVHVRLPDCSGLQYDGNILCLRFIGSRICGGDHSSRRVVLLFGVV